VAPAVLDRGHAVAAAAAQGAEDRDGGQQQEAEHERARGDRQRERGLGIGEEEGAFHSSGDAREGLIYSRVCDGSISVTILGAVRSKVGHLARLANRGYSLRLDASIHPHLRNADPRE
jgi:hypothetical protein